MHEGETEEEEKIYAKSLSLRRTARLPLLSIYQRRVSKTISTIEYFECIYSVRAIKVMLLALRNVHFFFKVQLSNIKSKAKQKAIYANEQYHQKTF